MPFTALPEIPQGGMQDWQMLLFTSFKENVELLTGSRGEDGLVSRAIIRGDIETAQLGEQKMGSITKVDPDGYNISSQDVAALAAFRALRDDVQVLANDLFYTRRALDALIRNMTGA